jgi:mono/diheme cytochrome c family protein
MRMPSVGLLLLCGCGAQPAVDAALQRMKDQPRYDVYQQSDFFQSGAAMQVPPAGTVSRERVLDPVLTVGRDRSGAYVREMPFGSHLVTIGQTRYQIFCAVCHGTGGYGGSIVAANLVERRPPSLRRPELRLLPAGYFYEVIRAGVGRMPSFAAELSVPERWAVVAYLQRLQRRNTATAEEREDSLGAAELRRLDSSRGRPR